jgi:hypothetical protein
MKQKLHWITNLVFVVVFPLLIFALVFSSGLYINYFESLILVFGVPSIYLSIRDVKKVRKVAWFSFLLCIPITIIFDLVVGFGDKGWYLFSSVLPYRLLGFIPVEDFLWSFLVAYVIIIFYEHFCNKSFQKGMSGKIKPVCYILYSATALVIITFVLDSSLLKIPYSYFWLGMLFWVVPIILFLSRHKSFFASFLKVDLFFLYLYTIYELIGLRLKLWTFPGVHYVAWVSILGYSFPLEEFLFIAMLGGFAACTYYEFCTNKRLSP